MSTLVMVLAALRYGHGRAVARSKHLGDGGRGQQHGFTVRRLVESLAVPPKLDQTRSTAVTLNESLIPSEATCRFRARVRCRVLWRSQGLCRPLVLVPTPEQELRMIKASADILTFPDLTGSLGKDGRPGGHQSRPAPRHGKKDGASAAAPGDSNEDTRERLLRHLIRLHGLVG